MSIKILNTNWERMLLAIGALQYVAIYRKCVCVGANCYMKEMCSWDVDFILLCRLILSSVELQDWVQNKFPYGDIKLHLTLYFPRFWNVSHSHTHSHTYFGKEHQCIWNNHSKSPTKNPSLFVVSYHCCGPFVSQYAGQRGHPFGCKRPEAEDWRLKIATRTENAARSQANVVCGFIPQASLAVSQFRGRVLRSKRSMRAWPS